MIDSNIFLCKIWYLGVKQKYILLENLVWLLSRPLAVKALSQKTEVVLKQLHKLFSDRKPLTSILHLTKPKILSPIKVIFLEEHLKPFATTFDHRQGHLICNFRCSKLFCVKTLHHVYFTCHDCLCAS